jgi:hypothetical protein
MPPVWREFGGRAAILPIDPLSGGTWIGVNDAGLVLCLLNATNRDLAALPRPGALRSRGEIIPSLLDCVAVGEAIGRAARLDCTEFPPFRLVAAGRTHVGVLASSGRIPTVQRVSPIRKPFLITSSGLGDELVDRPRRALFREFLRTSESPHLAQNRFHTHQWPDRAHLSVLMSRADARTVSRTIVELGADFARMTYFALTEAPTPQQPAGSMTLELSRRGASA